MVVVDSSVRIDHFNGAVTRETEILDTLPGAEPIVIGGIILAEVLQGFRNDRDFRRARAALDTLIFEPMTGRDVALAGARNFRVLRARGITVRKTIDMLIATFCMERGASPAPFGPGLRSDRGASGARYRMTAARKDAG